MKNIQSYIEESILKLQKENEKREKELRELITQRSTENSNEIERRFEELDTKPQKNINKTQQEITNEITKEQEEQEEIQKSFNNEMKKIKEFFSSFKDENQEQMKNIQSYIEESILKLQKENEKRYEELNTKLQENLNKTQQEITKKQEILKEEPIIKPTKISTTKEPKQEQTDPATAPSQKKKLSRQEKLAQRKQEEVEALKQEEKNAQKQLEPKKGGWENVNEALMAISKNSNVSKNSSQPSLSTKKGPHQDTPILDRNSNNKSQKLQQDTKKEATPSLVPKKPPTAWENLVIQPDSKEKQQSKKSPKRREEEPNKKLQQTNSASQPKEKLQQPVKENSISEIQSENVEQEENEPAPLSLRKNVWSAASIGLSEMPRPIEIKSMMKPATSLKTQSAKDEENKKSRYQNQQKQQKQNENVQNPIKKDSLSNIFSQDPHYNLQLPVSPKVEEQREPPKQLSPCSHTAWTTLTATSPYDDSKFINKTPYELRNSHNKSSKPKEKQKISKKQTSFSTTTSSTKTTTTTNKIPI